ncbi:MAG TPA: cation-transporting P-type ATPase [Jatrophihabitans sp.]|nr:cation-transporting P-type ATPase [Jatrophihabitans sp.]
MPTSGTSTVPSPDPTAAGLTSAEAAARLQGQGRNELELRYSRGLAASILDQLTDAVILVLLAAAGLSLLLGDYPDLSIILAVIVLNTAIGAAQQLRSDHALQALAAVTAPTVTVIRDARPVTIPVAELVEGDLLSLAAGDIVGADARLGAAVSLAVDESMITGESLPVGKAGGAEVLSGSVVVRGHGTALVERTGRRSAVGTIAGGLATAPTRTPLQRQLDVVGRRLAAAVAVAALVVALLTLARGQGWETSALIGMSLAVAAIPESLPAVVTLSLSLAGRSLSQVGVLVRRLSAIEALGSITVLATDKTGTLTEGRMTVTRVWTPDGSPAAERELLEAAALCSDACADPGLTPQRRDDPTEVALIEAAVRSGVDVPAARARWPRIAETPFEAATARMTTVHRSVDGETRTLTKGAPERLLDPSPVEDDRGCAAVRAAAEFAEQGLRVLAVRATQPGASDPNDAQSSVLLGLIGLQDPPRLEAAEVLAGFRRAGVRPVMITGDHPRTAASVAAALGFDTTAGRVVEAGQLAEDDSLAGVEVLARVSPELKSGLVARLQRAGEVVAMTGDGVNDAPALSKADVGVAMGGGTEVAKQAASLILTDGRLSALIPAVIEGRRVYANISRFLRYALAGGVAEILLMISGPLVGVAVPLRAGQILWVNLLTHGLPGVAIGNEPAARGLSSRRPRPPGKPMLDGREWRVILFFGALVAAGAALPAWLSAASGRTAQSTLFVALTCCQLAVALASRPDGRLWRGNRGLLGAVALNLLLILGAVQLPVLAGLFEARPLTVADGIAVAAATLAVFLIVRLWSGSAARSS